MPMIKGALAFDGGSYRLCQVHMLGWDQHKTTKCWQDAQAHEAQKSQPHWRGAGSERDQPPLLVAETKDASCADKSNKALEKHP